MHWCVRGINFSIRFGIVPTAIFFLFISLLSYKGRRGRDHVDFIAVSITTNVVSLNPVHGKVYSIQQYVIQFVSDLRQVCVFPRVLRFPPPIKLTAPI
jgi:hypothetical protein